MRRPFHKDCFLKSRATLAFLQFTSLLLCSLLSIILTVWLLLALFASSFVIGFTQASGRRLSRRVCSSPSFQSSTCLRNRTYCPRKTRQSCRSISRPPC